MILPRKSLNQTKLSQLKGEAKAAKSDFEKKRDIYDKKMKTQEAADSDFKKAEEEHKAFSKGQTLTVAQAQKKVDAAEKDYAKASNAKKEAGALCEGPSGQRLSADSCEKGKNAPIGCSWNLMKGLCTVDDPSAANQNYRSAKKTLQDSKEELGRAEKHAESKRSLDSARKAQEEAHKEALKAEKITTRPSTNWANLKNKSRTVKKVSDYCRMPKKVKQRLQDARRNFRRQRKISKHI